MNEQIQHTFSIGPEYSEQRLDLVLSRLIPGYSRSLIQKWINDNQVTVNKNNTKPSYHVQTGDVILVNATITPAFSLEPYKIDFDVIFEDKHILVINKPSGLIVHPGAGNPSNTILNGLLYKDPSCKIIPRAGIVHRLDQHTSGLMVIAKTLPCYYQLIDDIKERTIKREYSAICHGAIQTPGNIDEPIGRHPHHRTKMSVNKNGKPAITFYRVIEQFHYFTWLRVKLVTGRTHQIRVHLTHIGHPIVGDQVYGSNPKKQSVTPKLADVVNSFPRQALHATKLAFNHPITTESLEFETKMPNDMQQLLSAMQNE